MRRVSREIGGRVGTPLALAFLTGLTCWVALHRGRIPFTSDQALVGLMAQDILHHGQHPVFYQGAAYGGTLEPHYLAAFFAFLPETVTTYRLAMALLLVSTVLTVRAAAREAFGERAGNVAGLALAIGPPYLFYKGLTSDGAYSAVLLLGAGILFLLFRAERLAAEGAPIGSELAAVGFLGGVAWWVHPVSVVYAVPAMLLLLLGRLRTGLDLRSAGLALAGFGAGSLPWWVENVRSGWISFHTQALGVVAGRGYFAYQVRRIFSRGIPTLLGARNPSTLDARLHPTADRALAPGAGIVAIVLFGVLLLVALRAFATATTSSRRAVIGACLGLVVVPFPLALAMQRTDFAEPRYLLPVYLGAAALLGLAVSEAKRPAWALGLVPLTLVAHTWAPRMEDVELGFPSSRERLVAGLVERGVTAVYTSYWSAYRLTFLSGGRLVATPYGLWGYTPRPSDRKLVEESPSPAYLLQAEEMVAREAGRFEAYLKSIGAPYRREEVEGLALFTGIAPPVLATFRRSPWVPVAAVPGLVEWVTRPAALELVAGEKRGLKVTLRNAGALDWTPNVHAGYRWRDASGKEVPAETARGFFAEPLKGGALATVELPVEAAVPPGRYRLVVDLVDENIAWFEDRGVAPLAFDVTVVARPGVS